MSIVINTPNGNIGRPLVERLLEAGRKVTVISRSADKVADLVKRGARLVEGSIEDRATLDAALTGAEALFWLTPPPTHPDFLAWAAGVARDAAQVAKARGVKRVVVLSSIGAQNGPGSGPVGALKGVEEAFTASIPDVTILRPGFFMENLLRDVPSLARAGAIYSSHPSDKKFPMVAVADIAAKAAEVLLDGAWTGHRILGVHGPEDLSFAQATAIVSEALGRPVKYVQVTLEDARKGMLGVGIPPWLADIFTEMYGAVLDGRLDPAEPRSRETTTPTPLARFARDVLKPAVDSVSAAA